MLLPAVFLFILFLLLSAFFSSSETALIASNPFTLDYLEKKGSKRASLVRRLLAKLDDFLAAILIGNTLVNVAAASLATSIFVSFIPSRNQAVLYATLATTLLILFFGEINPKTFAAHNPVKVSLWLSYPIQALVILLYPLIKAFTFLSNLVIRPSRKKSGERSRHLSEEETRFLLSSGIMGMSSLRKKMISGVLDIGRRPVKEIMIPRPQVAAIEIESSLAQILETVREAGFSRYPVFRGRRDQIEGQIHTKDLIPYLIDNKEININSLLRKPFFIPESASLESALLQMQENTVHLAFVVDEFGNWDGIVTLEDIIGDIQDESDAELEDWLYRVAEGIFIVKGTAAIKDVNRRLPLELPEKRDYTTLAGFFLFEYGKIPHENDTLDYRGHRLIVEKMNKRHISLLRILLKPDQGKGT
jgi:putative hemolysin